MYGTRISNWEQLDAATPTMVTPGANIIPALTLTPCQHTPKPCPTVPYPTYRAVLHLTKLPTHTHWFLYFIPLIPVATTLISPCITDAKLVTNTLLFILVLFIVFYCLLSATGGIQRQPALLLSRATSLNHPLPPPPFPAKTKLFP